ncbi:MAG: hypothetical protein NTX45_25465 [Proteobacteria bacterium]|nr:hypothetical protein [Pseudomonadota bacterium]
MRIAVDYMLALLITLTFEKGVGGRHEDSMRWNKAATLNDWVRNGGSAGW